VVATICYAGAAVFSRGFRGLDAMAPAAGAWIGLGCVVAGVAAMSMPERNRLGANAPLRSG
jgi:hypothetical protein